LGVSELKHYGVLGMRWGVRKDRSYVNGGRISKNTSLLRISSAEKERHKGSAYAYINANLQQNINPYDKEKLSIDTGISAPNHSPSEIILSTINGAQCDKMTVMWMDTKEDLIFPSMKEKGEAFAKLYLQSEEARSKLAFAAYKPREELGTKMNSYDQNLIDKNIKEAISTLGEAAKVYTTKGLEFKKRSDDSYRFVDDISNVYMRTGYQIFYKALADKGIQKDYFAELKKQGYNAVTDDHDIRLRKERDIGQISRMYREKSFSIESDLKTRKKEDPLYAIKHPIENFKTDRLRKKYFEASKMMSNEKTNTPLKRELGGNEIIVFDRKKSLKVYQIRQIGVQQYLTLRTQKNGGQTWVPNPNYKK